MNFTQWIQAHRRSILFLLVLLAIAGVAASFKLPVKLFPKVDFPRIDVTLDAGDRPAEQMVLQVTRPVEVAVRRVPGVRRVRSTTSRGSGRCVDLYGLGHRHGDSDPAGQLRHQPRSSPPCRPGPRWKPGAWTRPSFPSSPTA